MKILITGGAGFIGSHLVEHYQGRAEIHVIDDLSTGHAANLHGLDCHFHPGSILDTDLLARVMPGVDCVFHLAALVSVADSVSRLADTVRLNVTGLLNVLDAARHAAVPRLCFASSAAVYGENPTSPKSESLTPDPRSPYAITKLDGEFYCALYAREWGLNTACLRFFNVFGPRQDPGGPYAAAVPIFIRKALRDEPITIHGDGGQTRDFIYVKDIVGALAFLADTPDAHGVYNAGYGESITIRDLVSQICTLSDSRSEILHTDTRAGDIRHSLSDVSRLRQAGWTPRHSFAEGLRETLAHFRTQPA